MMMLRWWSSVMLLTAMVSAGAQDAPIFHASFEGTLTATGPMGAVEPVQVVGGEPHFVSGRIGQALVAGAGQPLVHYPTTCHLIPVAGTVSLWVKPENWTPEDECFHSFFESGGEGADRNWLIFYKYYQRGRLLLRCSDAEGRVGMATAENLGWRPGEWHHLAATWSPKALRIYVDGEPVAVEVKNSIVPDRLGETFKVGDDGWHIPNPQARTLIDELRIYDHPLSASEIQRLAGRLSMQVMREPFESRWQVTVRLPLGITAGTVAIEVRPEEGETPVLTTEAEAADGAAQASLDVSGLPEGRYTVTARLVAEAPPTLPARVTMRRAAQAVFTLENERVRVVFDGATGGVLAIEAPDRGMSARERIPVAPLLTAETVSFMKNPWFYQDYDVTEVPADDGILRDIRLEPTETGQRLTIEYELPVGARATVTADLDDGEPVVRLRATVENSQPLWPSTAIRIPRVTFPMISGLRIGSSSEDDYLATGRVQGEERANPASRLQSLRVIQYPGASCLPWQDLFDASDGGVYLSPLTDGTCQLEILARGGDGLMALGNRWWTLLEPGETWVSPIIELGVHEGRWHTVAERFRHWALENTPPGAQPEWLAECDGWYGMGQEQYRWEDLPDILADAKKLGLFYLQMWSEMILGNTYYCYFYPNPRMGTEEELRAAIAAVHEGGGRVGFYSNVITFDGGIDQNPALLAEIDKYGLEEHITLPKFYEEVAPHVFIGPNGSYSKAHPSSHSEGGYVDGYWPMDPCSPWWREYLAGWIMRWQDDYGVDTWYLDSFPVHGYGIGPASFSLHLDHPMSTGEGQTGLLAYIRNRGFRGGLLYEGVACAALMPWTNWCLGTEYSFGSGEWSRPEIFCYSFGDVYPVFAGTANTWRGIGNIWTDLAEPRQEDAMNLVFLNGERFDILGQWPLEDTPYIRHLQGLLGMRRQLRDVVYGGRMMDVLGLSGIPDHVSARIFVRQLPPAAVVTVVDRREQFAPWELSVDTSALPWPEGISRATLLTLDGRQRPLRIQRDGTIIRISLENQGEVCAVRMQ